MCGPKGGRMGWSRWSLFLGVSLKAWLFLGVFRAGSFIFPPLRSPTFGAATALLLALCRSRRFRPGGHRPSRVVMCLRSPHVVRRFIDVLYQLNGTELI